MQINTKFTVKKIIKLFLFVIINTLSLIFLFWLVSRLSFYKAHNVMNHENIDRVMIINMDKSPERKTRYEKILRDGFGKKFFGQDISTLRFRATDGKKDLIFTDNKTKEVFSSKEVLNKKKMIKNSREYIIFDQKDPSLKIKYRINKKTRIERELSLAELGCLLSHLRAINEVVKNDYNNAIIMEDDFTFLVDPKKYYKLLDDEMLYMPRHFEIVELDKCKNHLLNRLKSYFFYGYNPSYVNAFFNRSVHSTAQYLISNAGAKRIMKFVSEYTFEPYDPADNFLFKTLPKNYNFNNIYYSQTPLLKQEKSLKSTIENK